MADWAGRRRRMVETQLAARGVVPRFLNAMAEVPREAFLPEDIAEYAYEDVALPLPTSHVLPPAYDVALMLDAAGISVGDKVLDLATGSGYVAAVASRIAGRVHAAEPDGDAAERTAALYRRLGYRNIEVKVAAPLAGWPEAAPYDVILMPDDGPVVPETLSRQLAVGGRLVVPLERGEPRPLLRRIVRVADDQFVEQVVEGRIGEADDASTGRMS